MSTCVPLYRASEYVDVHTDNNVRRKNPVFPSFCDILFGAAINEVSVSILNV